MPRIYISYREGDAPELTESVLQHLSTCFDSSDLVYAVKPEERSEAVSGCEALVLLIGPHWLKGVQPGAPGLKDPKDPVRLETETALAENLLIVPVPLSDVSLPAAQDLPGPMRELLRHPPLPLEMATWKQDLAGLSKRLETGLALRTIVQNTSLKRGSIHHRDLPEEDLLGFTDEDRPDDTFGISHSSLTDTRRAIDFQETALNLAREQKNEAAECRALGKLGLAFGRLGETQRAVEHFEAQLKILRRIGQPRDKGPLLANLGDAWAVRGDYPRAITYYNEQLGLALELNDRDMEAASQVGLGHCHIKLGEIERGVQFYRRAYDRIQQTGESGEQARLLVGLGLNCRRLGHPEEALEYLKQALELARRLGDRREESMLLGDLGDTYQETGEAKLALGFWEQQCQILEEFDDAPAAGRALLNLARRLHARGEPERAIEVAQRAEAKVTGIDYALRRSIESQLNSWRNESS